MEVARFSLASTRQVDRLISDYIQHSPALEPFINGFPSPATFEMAIASRSFESSKRKTLVDVLKKQYARLSSKKEVSNSIDALLDENTFSVATGHQLCLFTGPMYFIFKIASTIRLAQQLKAQFPAKNFVPVYWLASEDHDFEEINHTWIHGKKIEWKTTQAGAVGRMKLEEMTEVFLQLEDFFPEGEKTGRIRSLIREAYAAKDLASATQQLVHELFGEYGLIALNPDDAELKKLFAPVMLRELQEAQGDAAVMTTTSALQDMGYKTLVNPRKINLFYLQENFRGRIEFKNNGWEVVDSSKKWDDQSLKKEMEEHPENFSPNVIMRPLYQEEILPNLAYVGGPGEISYWMQLKSNFKRFEIPFPLLVLRDSALFLTPALQGKMTKLGITTEDIFKERNTLIEQLVPSGDIDTEKEKGSLTEIFAQLKNKATNVDPTLESFVNAELQRQLQSIDNIGKKIIRAMRSKEEVKLQQLEKLMDTLFPNGSLNERRDNFFPLYAEAGKGIIDELINNFDPLKGELKVFKL